MNEIDLKSKKSIYEQIVDGIKEDIISGILNTGDKLPSVRDLSAKLTVNPNTIQKAYKELENQGWIYSVSGLGNFVSEAERSVNPRDIEKLYETIGESIKQLMFLGVSERDVRYKLMEMTKGGSSGNDQSK